MMNQWILFSFLAFTFWGIWGFLGKLASTYLPSRQLVIYSILGYVLVFPIIILIMSRDLKFEWTNKGMWIALIAGVFSGAAYICYYFAIAKGEASRIVVITALYPILTCILSFVFLHEQITVGKVMGILCATVGIILLAR